MENGPMIMVAVLVGMVIPITLLLAALVFDFCVLVAVASHLWHDRGWPALRRIGSHAMGPMTARVGWI